MNEPFHLGLSILELSKILMYELWYDYVKQRWRKSKILFTKIMRKMLKTRFDTSDYELNKPLPKVMKDELCEEITKKIVGLRAKTKWLLNK